VKANSPAHGQNASSITRSTERSRISG
jgi:hypothetical protein